jgi:SSS family solute:Na+ symporter
MLIEGIHVWDIVIVCAYLAFIIWWGLHKGKSGDSQSYFLAGRSMPWWVVGLSLFAASISSTTLVGQSGDAYHTGIGVFNYNMVGVLVMIFFATFFLPLYIKSGIFTIPEFLEKRYDKRSRYYFSFICIVGNIFLDAAGALYAGALIIKLVLPEADLQMIILVFALITASYTIPGGLSSVINTELIQSIILIVGSVILTVLCANSGGWEHIQSLWASQDMDLKLIRPLDDPSTPWLGLIVGMPILGLYFWGNNQTMVQRVLSAKTVDEGRKGVLLNGAITLCTLVIIAIPGVMAQKLFPGLDKPDMVYPSMLLNLMPAGLMGIMFAALLAALTSALSAILNSTSTLFTMDFYSKFDRKADSKKLVRTGKIASVVIIAIATFWAPQIGKFGSLLKYYQEMLSYISPPIVAAFLLGIFNRRVNGKGIFWGLMAGLATALFLLFNKALVFGDIHFLLIVPFIFGFSVAVMYLVSLTAPRPAAEKLKNVTFTPEIIKGGSATGRNGKWYSGYRFWAYVLIVACAVIWIVMA